MTASNDNDVVQDDHFGLCPQCHQSDGYLNAGRAHWFYCDQHRVMWLGGVNIFSSHLDETEADQRRKFAKIESYREVEPFYRGPQGGHAA